MHELRPGTTVCVHCRHAARAVARERRQRLLLRAGTVAHAKAPFAPVVPQGQSSLPDGPTAVRADSLVTVSFDTPMIRTRIAAKFERLVRSTLPAVYGRSIESVLSRIPEGGIARQGD